MRAMKTFAPALVVLLLGVAPAFAHAHLVSETPAQNGAAAAPTELSLKFSEGVVLKFTGVTLTGPAGAVTLGAASLDPKDNTVLLVPVPTALPAGSYTVAWHALSSDGHKTTGSYSFTVN
jgi:methionine-rich copper-binding protein CopC